MTNDSQRPIQERATTLAAIDHEYVSLHWNATSSGLYACDPHHFLYEHEGSIVGTDSDGHNRTTMGRFRAIYIDLDGALNAEVSTFDVFDSDQRTFEVYERMFTSDGEVRAGAAKLLDEYTFGNLLVLDRLEILPEYRSHGLGLIVMRAIMERLSGGAFAVAIKPFPLQFEAARSGVERDEWRQRLDLSTISGDQRSATNALVRYYSRLGFVSLKGTPIMLRSTTWKLPSLVDLKAAGRVMSVADTAF